LDFLAAQDRERFVWARARWFNLNCCDWETKEPFSPSMIRAVFELLRTKQIITRAEKMRKRTSYRGWVVTQHSAITKTEGEWCVFCEKPGAPTGGETGAPTGDILVKTGGETGGVPGKNRRSESRQETDNTSFVHNGDGVLRPLNALSQVNELNVLSVESAAGRGEMQEQSQPQRRLGFSDDLTMTVGQSIGQDESLERMLDFISDGEFQTGALQNYEHISELNAACRDALDKAANKIFTDRTVCKRIMEHVNKTLLSENIQPPGGWVPVLKTLKAGGPIQMPIVQPPKYRCAACDGPTDGETICMACSIAGVTTA